MFCTNCHEILPDNVKFCTKCGAPVAPTAPSPAPQAVPPTPPVPPVPPSYSDQQTVPLINPQQPFYSDRETVPLNNPQQPSYSDRETVPLNKPQQPSYSDRETVPLYTPFQPAAPDVPMAGMNAPAAKAGKKFNPLFIIIPAVVVLAAAAVVLFFLLKKPAYTLDDFEEALDNRNFSTAFEICEQLPEDECEEVLEQFIIDTLNSGDDLSKDDKTIQRMFSKGFDDKFEELYNNYKNGEYTPDEITQSSGTGTSSAMPEESAVTSAPSETSKPDTEEAYTEESVLQTSAPDTPTVDTEEYEPPMYEMVVGSWRRQIRSGCFEYVVFLDDGTGYIYSDMVSEKVSANNSAYLYHDGKIHFTWSADDDTVSVDAEFDPYCFVAYQGYAREGHQSSATWKGSKNGSHDYYFAYQTQDDYLCDMLGLKNASELYSYDSLTRDYWKKALKVTDNAWDIYFNHSDQMRDIYQIDHTALADTYYSDPELRAQYEDVDLYHFVVFTEWLLVNTDNSTTVSLDFDLEDYVRAE